MIPFNVAWALHREILKTPLLIALADSVLWELEWRNTKKRWKREMPIWEKMREHGKGAKGKIAVIKLNIK